MNATTSTTTWPGPNAVRPALQRPLTMRLAQTEYQRVLDAVEALRPEDWTRPTDCTAWDVRQLVCHIAGHAQLVSTPLQTARQLRAAKARQQQGQAAVDALTAFQVEERQHLAPGQLLAELRRLVPRAVKGRRRIPSFVRRLRMGDPEIVNGVPETWTVGYVSDVILTHGCTGSTSPEPPVKPRYSPPTTTASSSPTSWPSGPAGTAGPTGWNSPVPPAGAGAPVPTVRKS